MMMSAGADWLVLIGYTLLAPVGISPPAKVDRYGWCGASLMLMLTSSFGDRMAMCEVN